MADLLVLSLGTTRGWRINDARLVELLRDAGASVTAAGVRLGAADRLRRGYPLNDLIEGYASRRAVGTALRRERPRAVIFCSTTPALMADPGVPFGIWLDSPARLNRPGLRNAAVHALERRAFGRAALLMPFGARDLGFADKTVPLAPPIVMPAVLPDGAREPLVVVYTPDPWAKGLELAVRSWMAMGERRGAAQMVITGIEPGWAREFLHRAGIRELPPQLTLAGMVPQGEFSALLARARVFLSAAAWEDFGMAPLEALGAGAVLCAAPAGGPFPALALARRLAPQFVAKDRRPDGVAAALTRSLEQGASASYVAGARDAVAAYSRSETVRRLRDQVLPRLL